jgi:hypothetical protein
LIVRKESAAKSLVSAFAGSKINDLEQERMVADVYQNEDFENRAVLIHQALRLLNEQNREVGELFKLAVHSILLAGSTSNKVGLKAHGGSSNACIGLIWLSLKPGLSTQDIVEMLIHELTHTLVFIDELNYGHFHYEDMMLSENWARSSILKRSRPMDKVVHSIVVATEILHARAKYLPNTDELSVHPDSKSLARDTFIAIDTVVNHPNRNGICQPRVFELVNHAKAHIEALGVLND